MQTASTHTIGSHILYNVLSQISRGKALANTRLRCEHTASVEQAQRIVLLLDLHQTVEVVHAPDLLGFGVRCTASD